MGENWIVQNCRKLIPVSDQYDGDNFFTLLNGVRSLPSRPAALPMHTAPPLTAPITPPRSLASR